MMDALHLLRLASDGSLTLVSYHPRDSLTWYWSVSLTRKRVVYRRWWLIRRDKCRLNQWHDYYRLPLGFTLIVSRQDYHKQGNGRDAN